MTKEQWSAHVRMMAEVIVAVREDSCDCRPGHDRQVGLLREAVMDLSLILDGDLCPDWIKDSR